MFASRVANLSARICSEVEAYDLPGLPGLCIFLLSMMVDFRYVKICEKSRRLFATLAGKFCEGTKADPRREWSGDLSSLN